jgi:rhodanese-related sulfurtransferase
MAMARRFVFPVLVAVMVVAVACGGSGEDDPKTAATDGPATLLDPDAFATRIARADATVINVHVPYEGEIEGTDALIPFDAIADDKRLPAAKDAEIVLYCRSGRMSVTAAKTLAAAGYTNLYDLKGGMLAWEAAGKRLVHRPA